MAGMWVTLIQFLNIVYFCSGEVGGVSSSPCKFNEHTVVKENAIIICQPCDLSCGPGLGLDPPCFTQLQHKYPLVEKCLPCISGFNFSTSRDTSSCKKCPSCPKDVIINQNCTATQPTTCTQKCRSPYYYDNGFCVKCCRCSSGLTRDGNCRNVGPDLECRTNDGKCPEEYPQTAKTRLLSVTDITTMSVTERSPIIHQSSVMVAATPTVKIRGEDATKGHTLEIKVTTLLSSLPSFTHHPATDGHTMLASKATTLLSALTYFTRRPAAESTVNLTYMVQTSLSTISDIIKNTVTLPPIFGTNPRPTKDEDTSKLKHWIITVVVLIILFGVLFILYLVFRKKNRRRFCQKFCKRGVDVTDRHFENPSFKMEKTAVGGVNHPAYFRQLSTERNQYERLLQDEASDDPCSSYFCTCPKKINFEGSAATVPQIFDQFPLVQYELGRLISHQPDNDTQKDWRAFAQLFGLGRHILGDCQLAYQRQSDPYPGADVLNHIVTNAPGTPFCKVIFVLSQIDRRDLISEAICKNMHND